MVSRKEKRRKLGGPHSAQDPVANVGRPSARRLLSLVWIAIPVALAIVGLIVVLMPSPDDLNGVGHPETLSNRNDVSGDTNQFVDDPAQEGWHSEVFSQAAQRQLDALSKTLLASGSGEGSSVEGEVADVLARGFRAADMRPTPLAPVWQDTGLIVRRWELATSQNDHGVLHQGRAGLAESWRTWAAWLGKGAPIDLQLKIFRVSKLPGRATTDVLFYARTLNQTNRRQAQGVWQCDWTWNANKLVGVDQRATGGVAPRLARIEVRQYEEAELERPGGFSDCTDAILSGNACYQQQLLPGHGAWLQRNANVFDRNLLGGLGLAIGDVNGDRRDDLYLCEQGALPNRLFLQSADGKLTEVGSDWQVDWLDQSTSALLVDLDNDGDLDLVVGTKSAVLLMENDRELRFELRAQQADVSDVYSLAAADFDSDGRVDVFVCGYSREHYDQFNDYATPVPYHDATNGGSNALLRNEGNWSFSNVTVECGLDENNCRWSYSAAWEDYDNDGDLDLYVANDYGPNSLYRNDGHLNAVRPKFSDVAVNAGVQDVGAGMSVVWGDYNHDGWMDLYVSNMFSVAGSRIVHQQKFKPDAPSEVRTAYQRMAKGNTLFENRGDGTFRDISEAAQVARAQWAWGTAFVDVNNDSWEDLIVANGYITADDTRDL